VDLSIALILVQDGIINGAIYGLVALSLVLVFTVTRVILLPQGEFVTYGALTLAALELGQTPRTVWLLVWLGGLAFLAGFWELRRGLDARRVGALAAETLVLPVAVLLLARWLAPLKPGLLVEMLLALAIVAPMGPYIYRIAFRPLSEASVLVLLIAAVGVHLAMTGLGLVFFGPEGSRTSPLSSAMLDAGGLAITGQSLWVVGVAVALMLGLYALFGLTLVGKTLRATAVNRLGARLVGIAPTISGRIAFTLAAFIGALSGILVAPITTIYYDTGFLVGLKGFVAAIMGGLTSYPAAALAAILVGIVESFSSFWASAFKEVIVFMTIIPVLLWRSLTSTVVEGEEE
jgi:branched-chain amino acid transport system permease protein